MSDSRSIAPRAIVAALTTMLTVLALAATAPAAVVQLEPSPAGARTFATSVGGWTSQVTYGGTCIVPGVTCAQGTATYQASGGTGGVSDGHLRSSVTSILGVLSDVTVDWSSPTFVAPAGIDQATISSAIRPNIANLLGVGGDVRLDVQLVDQTSPGTPLTIVGGVQLLTPTTSWGQVVQSTLPGGSIMAGHTYSIRLRTRVTTPVAISATGSVDIDDVTLRLTDLQPPTGLSASAPGSGAPQITGSVDPQAQSTTIYAEYGTSTAYGSTTGSTVVSGSGAQAYTLPLAGLTAGTTYHYRVVAQSADGTSSTSDATFVVPTIGANNPPMVAGAANVRVRTVTYDVPAGMTAATIQVLDSGANVVVATADADVDGTVEVTLPDADGAYTVRVARTTSGITATSTAVPATLDRVGPSTTSLGLELAPTLSSDVQRQVTFAVPSDAVSATAQVIDADGDPVGGIVSAAGGTATVSLGATDGSYRVRITLTDAAGNTSTATSNTVSLDTSAPGSGGAPVVTGAGSSRLRTVAFDRDPSATTVTVQVLDGTGAVVVSQAVASGGTQAITLPDLDGGYQVRVRQVDAATNVSVTPLTPIALDRVPPSAGGAPMLAGSPDDLSVSFTRDPSATTAVIEVVDNGVVVDTIPVPGAAAGVTLSLPAALGSYDIRVVQTDAAGNASTTPIAVAVRAAPPTGGPNPGPTTSTATNPGGSVTVLTDTNGPNAGQVNALLSDPGGFGTLLRSCYGAEASVTDVRVKGKRVEITGLSRYTPGTPIAIRDAKDKVVARTTAGASGRFRTTAPLPSASRRASAAYRAWAGGRASRALRLRRANVITSVSVLNGVATIRGRLDLGRIGGKASLQARGGRGVTACTNGGVRRALVGKATINRRTGAYRLRVRLPKGSAHIALRTKASGRRATSYSTFVVR